MRIPLPKGLEDAWAKAGKAGRVAVLAVVVGGVVAWTYFGADSLPQQQTTLAPADPLPAMKTKKAQTAGDWIKIQEKNVELEQQQRADKQQIAGLEQRFVALERDQQTKETQRQQQFDVKLKQALDAQASNIASMLQASQAKGATQAKKTVEPTRQPVMTPHAPAPAAMKAVGTLALDINTRKDWPAGAAPLPDAARAETAYLPAMSFAPIQLTDGTFANNRKGGASPISVAIKGPFQGPYHLHGPGKSPTLTRLHLEGCAVGGVAEADLGSGRVNMAFNLLVCVFPDKATFEKPIKAYAVGHDGTGGLPGRWETRESAYLARMALTSAMAGLADAFALANRTVIVTPFGGTTSTINENVGQTAGLSALSRAAADASKFYLAQAEQLMPVLWAESGTRGTIRLLEGLSLDGYPTQMLVSQGDLP